MSKLSRRSFLKGTAVSALGAAALGMTACSNNTAASSTASSAAASAPASSTPAQQPASAETGKPSFFTDPYQYKDTDAVQVVTTEVVVVGAGNAGCTAACSCVENGSEVVVIEAQNAIHGQGGGVGLCNTKYVQSLVDEGKLPHMTDVVEHQNIWVQRCGSRVNEALVSMWFNNSPEAGNWLIDKCAEFGVVPVSFRAHAPNAIIPESYDYHMFVNVGDHQFDSKCGYFAATNVLYEDSQNAEKYEHPATYFFNTKAQELLVEDGRVTGVRAGRKSWPADRVIVATGGASYPQTGSTGDGYRFAREAGHSVVPANPSLVPLVESGETCRSLMGLSLRNVQLTVFENEKKIYTDFGEMLFTHFGLSGPLVLSASAHMRHFGSKSYRVEIDLKPALDEKTLDKRLLADFDKHKNSDFVNALGELLPRKIIPAVIEKSGIDPREKVNTITKKQRASLLRVLKCFPVEISGKRPIAEAIVTTGGVSVREVSPKTMESKKCSGLYFAGEVLDVDAYTGGFNLQIAWSTGRLAGLSAAQEEK